MPCTCVVGLQWGDEAKGKVVDVLTDHHDIVVRYNGGPNAGHTVMTGNKTFKLSILPTGVIRPKVISIIGNGVVINPTRLREEISQLLKNDIDIGNRLVISDRAHIIFPYHVEQEKLTESKQGQGIGTTGRGIGPCYQDKVGRVHAIRTGELTQHAHLKERLDTVVDFKNTLLRGFNPDAVQFDAAKLADEFHEHGQFLKPHLTNTVTLLHQEFKAGKNILFEGAQGTLLDVDHGTYPFVTSSNCVAGNAAAGSGVGPGMLHYILGITKAYCTRVGGGPFPTELDWETPGTPGYHMSTVGAEKGVTTGRSRRCGWFDAALLKRSAQVNGLSGLCITKLDVLDGLKELLLCTAYELDGETIDILPMGADEIARCKPIYEVIPGWTETTVGVTDMDKLPATARRYLERIAEVTGVPVHVVSTSPDRDHTILLHNPFGA